MDYINLEVVGVFKDTDKTITTTTIRIVKPEIRTLNKARAI
jgi:hypothetical protein